MLPQVRGMQRGARRLPEQAENTASTQSSGVGLGRAQMRRRVCPARRPCVPTWCSEEVSEAGAQGWKVRGRNVRGACTLAAQVQGPGAGTPVWGSEEPWMSTEQSWALGTLLCW